MKPGTKIGAAAKIALVLGATRGEAVDATGILQAGRERPSGDDLVADILVDFAAGLGDGERQVGNETVEKSRKRTSPRRSAIAVEARISMNSNTRSSRRGW